MTKAKRPSKRASVQNSLIAAIKREPAPRCITGTPAWWLRIPAKTLTTLVQIRAEYIAGQFPGWNLRQLFARVKDELALTTNDQGFRRFMREFNGEE